MVLLPADKRDESRRQKPNQQWGKDVTAVVTFCMYLIDLFTFLFINYDKSTIFPYIFKHLQLIHF